MIIVNMSEEKKVEKVDEVKLQQETAERIAKCTEELNALLEKHNCTMTAEMVVSPRGNSPVVRVVSK